MTMSADLVQVLLAQVTTACFNALMTLTVKTAKGTSVWHICNNMQAITFNGVTYQPINFTFDPPDASREGTAQNGQITIAAVDQALPQLVLSATDTIRLSISTLVSKETGASEELEDWDFILQNAQWNAAYMSAELVYDTYMDVMVPGLTYDAEMFPGCW